MLDRIAPFVLVCLIFATSAVYAESTSTDQSKGIVVFPLNKAPFNIQLHEKPDDSAPVMALLMINPQANPTHSSLFKQWEEPNPDAGWFDDKTTIHQKLIPLTEYVSDNGRAGPYVFDETPNWVRFEEGWMKKSALSQFDGVYSTWNNVMSHDQFPEFHLPDQHNYTPLGKMETMRTSAVYRAHPNVDIYKTKGGTQRLMQADDSLRFAIMGREGDWVNIFVVLNTCDARNGKRDYREGTNGWIPIRQTSGQPSLIKKKEKC